MLEDLLRRPELVLPTSTHGSGKDRRKMERWELGKWLCSEERAIV